MGRRNQNDPKIVPAVPPSIWLATLTLSVFGLALPVVMLQIFDRIIPFQATETLLVLMLGLLVIIPLEMMQKILRAAVMNAQAMRYSRDMSALVVNRVLNAREGDAPAALAKVHALLQSPAPIRSYLWGTGRLFLIELPFSAIALGLIWLLAGPLVLVPLTGFTFLFLVASLVRLIHRKKLSAREEADARRYYLFEQLIGHIDSIKANQLETWLNSRFRKEQNRATLASRSVYFSSNLFQSLAQSINLAFSAAIVCGGAYLVLQRQIGAAELAACTMLNGRAAQPLMHAAQQWTSREGFSKARETVAEALALAQTPELPKPHDELSGTGAQIAFEDVTLRAGKSGRALLRNFTFTCDGGFVSLTSGATGNARAAFRCLLGEAVPEQGKVLINQQPAADMARFRGYGGIVYVDDKLDAFEGSLIFNIALCDDPDTVDRAYEAAKLLGLEDDINKLPNGYLSDMRESGILMASRGFLQRINLARALAHQPSILLVDDAINAMDTGMQLVTAAALQVYARDHLVLAYDSSHLLERFTDDTVNITSPSRARLRPQMPQQDSASEQQDKAA